MFENKKMLLIFDDFQIIYEYRVVKLTELVFSTLIKNNIPLILVTNNILKE